jgi:hypothetical protein
VLFARTSDLVQKLQVARRELGLESAINRLDRFHLLILDDLAYVSKDQAETSVLFELISARYERRSTLITANQPFGGHDDVPVTRHAKVQGKRSPLNPDDRNYWEQRRHRRLKQTLRPSKRSALLRRQDDKCAMCGVRFDPDEDIALIDEHHIRPRCSGGTDQLDNLQLVHRWCHHAHHARIGYPAAEA